MPELLYDLIQKQADITPTSNALLHKNEVFTYSDLKFQTDHACQKLLSLNTLPGERVAVYLPKIPQTVFGLKRRVIRFLFRNLLHLNNENLIS